MWAIPGALVLTLLVVTLVVLGNQEVQAARKHSRPTAISCKEFLAGPPRKGWSRIKDCYFRLHDAVWVTDAADDELSTGTDAGILVGSIISGAQAAPQLPVSAPQHL